MKKWTPGFSDSKGIIAELPVHGGFFAVGTTVPSDTSTGYAPGCIFLDVDGTTGAVMYVNDGTKASCDFNVVNSAGNVNILNNTVLSLGTGGDTALYHKSTSTLANTAITNVLIGTPVTNATAADSFYLSNTTASGDITIAANRGGASETYLFIDSSTGDLYLNAPALQIIMTPTTDVQIANGTGLIVGHTAQMTIANGDGTTSLLPELQVLGTTKTDSSMILGCWSATATSAVAPSLNFAKSASASIGGFSAVASGEVVGEIVWSAADGTDLKSSLCRIQGIVDTTPGTGDMPGRLVFSTSIDAGEVLTEALRIDNAQRLVQGGVAAQTISDGDGTTSSLPRQQILGASKANGSQLIAAFSATSTSAACPSLNFLKSAHATVGSNTVVVSGEILGEINFFGADGTDFKSAAARIACAVDASPGTGDMPGRIMFSTTTDAGETLSERMRINSAGGVLIGTTSNAGATAGLTVMQGAADDEILAFKSSDVTHGMTVVTETDTYGRFTKFAGNDGGLFIDGLCDTGSTGLRLRGVIVTDTATRSTAGIAPIMFDSALKSTTTVADNAADKNIMCFRNNATTRFILDSDGDSFQDVGTAWTNFDSHDDLTLLNSMSNYLARPGNAIAEEFGSWLSASKEKLESMKLVYFNEDTDGRAFVNMSKLNMLNTGAIRQLGLMFRQMQEEIVSLKAQLAGPGPRALPES